MAEIHADIESTSSTASHFAHTEVACPNVASSEKLVSLKMQIIHVAVLTFSSVLVQLDYRANAATAKQPDAAKLWKRSTQAPPNFRSRVTTRYPEFPMQPYYAHVTDGAENRSEIQFHPDEQHYRGFPTPIFHDKFPQRDDSESSSAASEENDVLANVRYSEMNPRVKSQVRNETYSDLWATVPIANVNGFLMPIVPPMIEKQVQGRQDLNVQQRRVSSDAESLPVMCGEYTLVPESSLRLASPYFPANYPDNFSCRWSITGVAGEKVALQCHNFTLAEGDYLALGVEGDSASLIRYTSLSRLSLVVLPSNEVFVSFFSDATRQSQGFSCTAYSMGVEDVDESLGDSVSAPLSSGASVSAPSLSHAQCGLVNRPATRIVNGQEADKNEYPWQAYLRIAWQSGTVSGCGGSVISERWVISAAHCLMKKGDSLTPRVTVYAGVHNLADSRDSARVVVEASKIVIHPKNSFSYDLALVQLSSPLKFTTTLRPICLPSADMQTVNISSQPLTMIGWGLTETGSQPTTLRELDQVGMDWQSCKKVYGEYVTDHHFCSTASNAGHICLGDSGGPAMIVKDGRFYLRGVISFVATKDCNLDYPDGHTSVTHFLPWIQDVTGISV